MAPPLTLTMVDAVDVSALPDTSTVIGVYVDPPPYINTIVAVRTRFPNAKLVTITASGVPGAQIGDCESGNMDPAQLAQWDADELAVGRTPTNYSSLSTVPQIVNCLRQLNIDPTHVNWFPADWPAPGESATPHLATLSTGTVTLPVVGTQYANPPSSGGDYDLSLALASWLYPNIPPIPGDPNMSALSVVIVGGMPQAFYVDGNGDVIQLFLNKKPAPSTDLEWVDVNVTSLANAPKAAL